MGKLIAVIAKKDMFMRGGRIKEQFCKKDNRYQIIEPDLMFMDVEELEEIQNCFCFIDEVGREHFWPRNDCKDFELIFE
jgi:hypothetical protein